MPEEFFDVAKEIAAGIGDLPGCDSRNPTSVDQRFCVALQAGQGWYTTVGITNATTKEKSLIVVDYYNLPIRCRICHSIDYLAKECKGAKRPLSPA